MRWIFYQILYFRCRRHLLDFRHQDDRRHHVGVDVNGWGRGLHQLVHRSAWHRGRPLHQPLGAKRQRLVLDRCKLYFALRLHLRKTEGEDAFWEEWDSCKWDYILILTVDSVGQYVCGVNANNFSLIPSL